MVNKITKPLEDLLAKVARTIMDRVFEYSPDLYRRIAPGRIDEQTGTLTKYCFENEVLPRSIRTANEEHITLAYIMVDIDDFKKLNTTHGHMAGDEALEHVVANLVRNPFVHKKGVRHYHDYVAARVGGGEEFGILLMDCPLYNVPDVANRIRENIASKLASTSKGEIPVTVSMGVCYFHEGMFQNDLVRTADEALQMSKSSGKNRITCASNVGYFFQPSHLRGDPQQVHLGQQIQHS